VIRFALHQSLAQRITLALRPDRACSNRTSNTIERRRPATARLGGKTGAFAASMVVSSDGTDPTRLQVPISIGVRG
jgi:hypothetical protein